MRIPLSVVIPTYLPRFLAHTLKALSEQSHPNFEVVVVENSEPSSQLRNLTTAYRNKLKLRHCLEPRVGINNARNRGVRKSSGEIVALLDDDCVPANDWIEQVLSCHHQQPAAGVIGGRVRLRFFEDPPLWLNDEFKANLSQLHWSNRPTALHDPQYLIGANLSFKRSLFDRTAGFPADFGMIGRQVPQLVHDEKIFVRQAARLGKPGKFYTPKAVVEHLIPLERVDIRYHEQRRYGLGVSDMSLLLLDSDQPRPQGAAMLLQNIVNLRRLAHSIEEGGRFMDECTRRLYAINLLRTRVAQLCGLQDCLLERVEPGTIDVALEGSEHRSYECGERIISQRRSRRESPDEILAHALGIICRDRVSTPHMEGPTGIRLMHNRIAFIKGLWRGLTHLMDDVDTLRGNCRGGVVHAPMSHTHG